MRLAKNPAMGGGYPIPLTIGDSVPKLLPYPLMMGHPLYPF